MAMLNNQRVGEETRFFNQQKPSRIELTEFNQRICWSDLNT